MYQAPGERRSEPQRVGLHLPQLIHTMITTTPTTCTQANNVASSNALALVLINSGKDGEDLFRVAATLGGRSGGQEEPKGPENMPTVSRCWCQRQSVAPANAWWGVVAFVQLFISSSVEILQDENLRLKRRWFYCH